ncbi:MAG: four helix bundle protein [Bacteroidetes bacterium]|nr:four helix bundle protein [Bacteroidota bacterium]
MMLLTDLEVWKAAMDLSKNVYETTLRFTETESNGLGHQMRNCVTGIPANISAAASRKHGKESLMYLQKCKGIIYEIESQMYLAEMLGYTTVEELHAMLDRIETTKRLLFGFIKHYQKSSEPQTPRGEYQGQ